MRNKDLNNENNTTIRLTTKAIKSSKWEIKEYIRNAKADIIKDIRKTK